MDDVSEFEILGESRAALEIYQFARRAAAVDAPVLLTGESGTGKGLLARAIHGTSRRAARPLVAINCAGVPDSLFEAEFFGHIRGAFTGAHESRRGLFEQADGGTLFLDEIGELPLQLQAKLLTALEDGEIRRIGAERTRRVDVRLIAATGVDLAEAVRDRRFRRDLYHRLLVLSFHLPPLRRREGDITHLARHYLDRFRERYRRPIEGFDPAALERLEKYPWPGNIRELAHAVEAAVLHCDAPRIRVRDLPDAILAQGPGPATEEVAEERTATEVAPPAGRYSFYGTDEEERDHIAEALRRYHGNKTRAARALGMARSTLRQKLRSLGLDPGIDG